MPLRKITSLFVLVLALSAAAAPAAESASDGSAGLPLVSSLHRIARGDSLARLLAESGADPAEVGLALKAFRRVMRPRRIQPGQALGVDLLRGEDGLTLQGFRLRVSPEQTVRVARDAAGAFAAETLGGETRRELRFVEGRFGESLLPALRDTPIAVLSEMTRLFGARLDLERELAAGDRFRLLYEAEVATAGGQILEADLLYAALDGAAARQAVYRYEAAEGEPGHYDAEGRPIAGGLIATPVEDARLTSGFGPRLHPILGYTRMHRGLDYAAPAGTPVVAAGDGTVVEIGRRGASGLLIRLDHGNGMQSVYAHLARFAPGLAAGSRVVQGETIARVGSSGRSTGPHLHYEVLRDGRRVDPRRPELLGAPRLAGAALAAFQRERRDLEETADDLARFLSFAALASPDSPPRHAGPLQAAAGPPR